MAITRHIERSTLFGVDISIPESGEEQVCLSGSFASCIGLFNAFCRALLRLAYGSFPSIVGLS